MKIEQINFPDHCYNTYHGFAVNPIRTFKEAAAEFNRRNPDLRPMSKESAQDAEMRARAKLRKALEELDAIDAEREEADAR